MSSAFEGLPKTPNLKLNKPGYDNVADIEALNENSDILDDEINTIKSNLKNKGSATEPIYFDGNGVPQKTKNFTDYLPLAGGTMTGAIETNGDIINPSNNNTFIRIKGSKEYQQGAELLLSGKTLTDHEGLFYLIANNGTKSTKLLGKADGNLLWGAKHIARSVNGINATPDGNVDLGIMPIANGGTGATTASEACANIGALPTSGGTITGAIKMSGNVIENIGTIGSTNICGGTNLDDGACLILRGKDQTNINGRFELNAQTDEYKSYLTGFPTGELIWSGDGETRRIIVEKKDSVGTNYAQLKADGEGGNLRLQKSNGVGLEFDTCLMNGTTGSARIYFNKPNAEAWKGFNFYETGEIKDGDGYLCDSVVAQGTNYIKYRSGLIIQWGTKAYVTNGATITFPIPFSNDGYAKFVTGNDPNGNHLAYTAIQSGAQAMKVYVSYTVGINWLAIGY